MGAFGIACVDCGSARAKSPMHSSSRLFKLVMVSTLRSARRTRKGIGSGSPWCSRGDS
jgi:hypothetical protein